MNGSSEVSEFSLKFKSIKFIKSLKTKESSGLRRLLLMLRLVRCDKPVNVRESINVIERLDKLMVLSVEYDGIHVDS